MEMIKLIFIWLIVYNHKDICSEQISKVYLMNLNIF